MARWLNEGSLKLRGDFALVEPFLQTWEKYISLSHKWISYECYKWSCTQWMWTAKNVRVDLQSSHLKALSFDLDFPSESTITGLIIIPSAVFFRPSLLQRLTARAINTTLKAILHAGLWPIIRVAFTTKKSIKANIVSSTTVNWTTGHTIKDLICWWF